MSAWIYFIVENADGTARLVVRRNGPVIELLNRQTGWIDAPELLPRFWDPGYLEEVSLEEARAAAETVGIAWPIDGIYVDVDATDEFLDIPEPRYQGRTPEESSAAVDRVRARVEAGEIEPLKLPPI